MLTILWLKLLILVYLVDGYCDSYFQKSNYSKQIPFHQCDPFFDEYQFLNVSTSFFCNDSSNSTDGFIVFQQNFNTPDCEGDPFSVSAVPDVYNVQCGSKCDILKLRQYPLTNTSTCSYNQSLYHDDILMIDHCYREGPRESYFKAFCSTDAHNNTYWWRNFYFTPDCSSDTLVTSLYNVDGCSPLEPGYVEPSRYTKVIQCDYASNDSLLHANTYSKSNEECGNYWIPEPDVYKEYQDERIPFDECNSNYSAIDGDSSFKYICNDSYYANYTVNGYTVFKAMYNTIDCQGNPIISLFEDIKVKAINCNASNPCDVIKIREYQLPSNITSINQCLDIIHNVSEIKLNEYDYEDVVVMTVSTCMSAHEQNKQRTSFAGCNDDSIFMKQYNDANCDEDEIQLIYYRFLESYCDEFHYFHIYNVYCLHHATSPTTDPTAYPSKYPSAYPTENPTAYPTVYRLINATNITENKATKPGSTHSHLFDNDITSRQSSAWATQVIAISSSVIVVLVVIIILFIIYRKVRGKSNKDNTELLQLVDVSDSENANHQQLTKVSPPTISNDLYIK